MTLSAESFLSGYGQEAILIVLGTAAVVLAIFAVSACMDYFSDGRRLLARQNAVLAPRNTADSYLRQKPGEGKDGKKKKPAIDLSQTESVKMYRQFVFFGGSPAKFFFIYFGGYLAFFAVYLLISGSAVIALLLALEYLAAAYLIMSGRLKKKRISYLSSFISSIDTLSAAFAAGNTFEEGISEVACRENINPKLRREFAVMSNDIKSGLSLTESVSAFVKRNTLFEEFSMFGIAIEFYDKSGGRNLCKIFEGLKESLSSKITNYAEIEGKISSYEKMFNIFIVIIILATLVVKMFMSSFYVTVLSSPSNIAKLAGGIIASLASAVFMEKTIKDAAEG